MNPEQRRREVQRLHRSRPRSALLRWSGIALGALALFSLVSGEVAFSEARDPRRWSNLRRFLSEEALPRALAEPGAGWIDGWNWGARLWRERGAEALGATLSISLVAMGMAALLGSFLALASARSLMRPDPLIQGEPQSAGWWPRVGRAVRWLCTLLRAIPEYVWAFLLLSMWGATAWPAIVALALHNAGILGRLGAETIEDTPPRELRALRMLGANRRGLAVFGLWPGALTRYALFVFYRFETCVREATVLGLLGISSLGYWVQDARARQHYDDMLLFIGLGALLVLGADVASLLLRRWVRRAG